MADRNLTSISSNIFDAIRWRATDRDGLSHSDRHDIHDQYALTTSDSKKIKQILNIFADLYVDSKERGRLIRLLNLDPSGQSRLDGIIEHDGMGLIRRRFANHPVTAFATLGNARAHAKIRAAGALYIGKSNDPTALQVLAKALKAERDWSVRFAIAKALVAMDSRTMKRADVIAAFVSAYRKGDQSIRLYVLSKLQRVADRRVTDVFIDASANRNPVVRRRSLSVLVKLNDPKAEHVFFKAIKDGDPGVRMIAISALSRVHTAKAFFALVSKPMSTSDSEQQAVDAAIKKLLQNDVVNASVHLVLMQRGRLSGNYMLRKLKTFNGQELLPKLVKVLKQARDIKVRLAAASVLKQFKGKDVADAFASVMSHPNLRLRRIALVYLGRRGDMRAARGLALLLGNKDWSVRRAAVRGLSGLQGKRAFSALVVATRDRHPWVRVQAVRALAKKKEAGVVRVLRHIAFKDLFVSVRGAAALALGMTGDKKLLPDLLKLVKDTEAVVRRNAVMGLAKLGGVKALRAILSAAKDSNASVRGSVKPALALLQDPPAIRKLMKALNGSDESLSEAADYVLKRIISLQSKPAEQAKLIAQAMRLVKQRARSIAQLKRDVKITDHGNGKWTMTNNGCYMVEIKSVNGGKWKLKRAISGATAGSTINGGALIRINLPSGYSADVTRLIGNGWSNTSVSMSSGYVDCED